MNKFVRMVVFMALIVCVVSILSGCAASSFYVKYQVEKKIYGPGDTVRIDVLAKNTGNRFVGGKNSHSTSAALYFLEENGEEYYIFFEASYANAIEPGEQVYYQGDLLELTYNFIIPETPPLGEYDLVIWLYGVETTLVDVLEIQNGRVS